MPTHAAYAEVLAPVENVLALANAGARLVQVDLDPEAYEQGHIPGAIPWRWETQLRSAESQEILSQEEFESLMSASGITPDTQIVLYGDNNNWFACWAFWLLHLYGHTNVLLIDGGIRKWLESGLPLSIEAPVIEETEYRANGVDLTGRASTQDILNSFFKPFTHRLLDVRSEAEYIGTLRGPGIGADATCAIGGHIPTAINIPWNLNCNEDGTFKSPAELLKLYASFDILPQMQVITYCAIGERASLSWFVLKHLMGYDVVMNFDRSMSQWSRLSHAPIASGVAA